MEADPNLFEADEVKFAVLKESNQARLDILTNLLTMLGVDATAAASGAIQPKYAPGYFLGRHEVS